MPVQKFWYIKKGAHHQGPFSIEDLIAFASQGKISRTDTIWKRGMKEWVQVQTLPQFAGAFPKKSTAPKLPDLPPVPPMPKAPKPELQVEATPEPPKPTEFEEEKEFLGEVDEFIQKVETSQDNLTASSDETTEEPLQSVSIVINDEEIEAEGEDAVEEASEIQIDASEIEAEAEEVQAEAAKTMDEISEQPEIPSEETIEIVVSEEPEPVSTTEPEPEPEFSEMPKPTPSEPAQSDQTASYEVDEKTAEIAVTPIEAEDELEPKKRGIGRLLTRLIKVGAVGGVLLGIAAGVIFYLMSVQIELPKLDVGNPGLNKLTALAEKSSWINKPEFEVVLSLDGKRIWLASTFPSVMNLKIQFKSLKNKVMSSKPIVFHTKTIINESMAMLDRIKFEEGSKISPGHYMYIINGEKKDRFTQVVLFLKDLPVIGDLEVIKNYETSFRFRGTALLSKLGPNRYKKALEKYQDDRLNEMKSSMSEIFERYTTLGSLVDRMVSKWDELTQAIRKGSRIRQFELYYAREIGPFLQAVMVESSGTDTKRLSLRKGDLQELEKVSKLGQKIGAVVVANVYQVKEMKKIRAKERNELRTRFFNDMGEITDLITKRKEEYQWQINNLKL